MVALDENIGNGPLSRELQKRILDGVSVVHLVQLDNLGIDSLVKEQILGLAAERTEGLGEYDHLQEKMTEQIKVSIILKYGRVTINDDTTEPPMPMYIPAPTNKGSNIHSHQQRRSPP